MIFPGIIEFPKLPLIAIHRFTLFLLVWEMPGNFLMDNCYCTSVRTSVHLLARVVKLEIATVPIEYMKPKYLIRFLLTNYQNTSQTSEYQRRYPYLPIYDENVLKSLVSMFK